METQKAYKNLYSTDNIDASDIKHVLDNEDNKTSCLNIIKINMASLELDKTDQIIYFQTYIPFLLT